MAATGSRSAALQRRSYYWPTGVLIAGVILALLIPAPGAAGQQLRVDTDLSSENETGICTSVDIRNSIETFEKLRGCRVVEGFVQILLFDNVNESLFTNISFPELTEITDYLLLFRVNGLRSLGHLFPNLAVIRGQKLFLSYAFIIFEMSSLQEIGLYSLTDITRGQIRIDKNPSLCFVNSIDWNLITHEKREHFIKSIKPENECPICPAEVTLNGTAIKCHKVTHKPGSEGSLDDRYLCWNKHHCQKVCPENCSACYFNGECCDHKCLGGCSEGRKDACFVCRNFSMGSREDRQCMSHCPDDYFEYLERRCIKKEECIKLKQRVEQHGRGQDEHSYKIFNRSCILQCPTNYMDDYIHHTCKPCEGRCKKECPGINIDSLPSAQQLRGCTHIKGSLEIQIRGGRNIVTELEENLNMIEEIDGYIKIVRSFPLVSLNFLKNLRVIHGNTLESQKYVFVVLDNQNLQDLWDWTNRTLKLGKGRLFFHFNPKLCVYKIEKLNEMANLSMFTELEVASNSNGDKIACNVTEMQVFLSNILSKAVVLQWQPFKMDDQRKLLGYVIYSIEAPYRNITLYDGRDACGGDGWRVDDVPKLDDNNSTLSQILTQLKPYTQYAFYVKTYTIATERSGAQSLIRYFRTKPDVPSIPLNVQVSSNASDTLIITWQSPLHPNGNVTYYIVSGEQHKDTSNKEWLNDRNYCKEPSSSSAKPTVEDDVINTTPRTKSNETCSCDSVSKPATSKHDKEKEVLSQINFENELHNHVYIKRSQDATRRKRDVGNKNEFPNHLDKPYEKSNNVMIQNVTELGTDIWESFKFPVYGKTEFFLNKLHHFTVYDIYIQACREKDGANDLATTCSSTYIKTARTLRKDGADNITQVRVTNQSLGMISITWEEPADPNGLILSYEIEYRRTETENSAASKECIPRMDFLNQSMVYTVKQLNAGNYTLKLRAISQAGPGHYSSDVCFYIKDSNSSSFSELIFIIFLVVVLILGGFCCYKKFFAAQVPSMKLITSVNPEYVSTVYVPDDWEVSRKKIELIKELGQGSFGMVYEGIARDIRGKLEIRCAVKTVNEHATNRERIEFLNEASVMKAFDTIHVVRLLGVVSQGQPTLVIMELMANGDLKSYLRSHRPDAETYTGRQPPTLKRILQMAIEIADGMAYLSAKKFVHRDLAARNCMVAEDLTVKIGDFGMTRDIYETDYYRKGTKGLLPVRWMAPESLKDGVFTSSSDVWSYGVVLWEMATLASQPYQGLSNDQVLRYVIDGGVMERPDNCPDKLYSLMRYCWQHKPSSRPSFLELASHLLEDATASFSQVSFYHSSAGVEARNANPTPSPSQDDPSTPLRMARDLDEDYSMGSSESESEPELVLDADPHIGFPSFQPAIKEGSATANGFVSGHPTNGTASTQC